MSTCSICGGPNPVERVEIGYTHCTTKSCVATWRNRRIQEKGLSLVLVPKQGMAWVSRTDAATNTRSSGK